MAGGFFLLDGLGYHRTHRISLSRCKNISRAIRKESFMKLSQIPDVVTLPGPLYKGKYVKRAGSMKDKNLYCWFHEEGDSLAHVSIDMEEPTREWTEFHVTYPVKKQAAWSDEIERARYSVYFKVVNTKELQTIKETGKTSVLNWKVNEKVYKWADLDRQAMQIAKEFYSSAFNQAVTA
jgi:hypothetical protein